MELREVHIAAASVSQNHGLAAESDRKSERNLVLVTRVNLFYLLLKSIQ